MYIDYVTSFLKVKSHTFLVVSIDT